MSIYAKITGAKTSEGGNWIRDGRYKLACEKIEVIEGHSGTCGIVEYRVLEAAATSEVDERGNPVVPNKVGSSCSVVCNMTKHESAAGNFKSAVLALLKGLGYSDECIDPKQPDDKGEKLLAAVCGPKQPLRGVVVGDETYRKAIRSGPNAGKPTTRNRWKSIAQDAAAVKVMRAKLDATAAASDAPPPTPAPQQITPAPAVAPTPAPQPAAAQAAAPAALAAGVSLVADQGLDDLIGAL